MEEEENEKGMHRSRRCYVEEEDVLFGGGRGVMWRRSRRCYVVEEEEEMVL